MEDQPLKMFVILETSVLSSKPKINAIYDCEEKAKRRFSEIAIRKSKDLSDSFEKTEEGTISQHLIIDVADLPSHILMSKNIVCETTKIIPAGYFTAEQKIINLIPMLTLDLYSGCERISLQKHEHALRQWREAEEALVWKVQSYAAQHAWMEEQKRESDARALEAELEINRLETILDSLETTISKLSQENARLTAENSKLQLENLGLYRSLQSPQQAGPFTSVDSKLPTTQSGNQRQPALFLVGPPYPEHFMTELRKKINARK